MRIKFLDLNKIHNQNRAEYHNILDDILNQSAFIGGAYLQSFENSFRDFIGAKYCVGVANGTDALEIAIESLDFSSGEIIVPANTFIASAEAVSRNGLKPVFCDVNNDDYTIDVSDLEKRITRSTVAIMCVHLYGHPCDMAPILNLAKKYNLKVIEDCSQAHGAKYKGSTVGSLGDVGCFSFYPGKNLGGFGDAGAIVTNDKKIADLSRLIANHGRIEKYDHKIEGRNSRLDNIQAAVLSLKLKYLGEQNELRKKLANCYMDNLVSEKNITLPSIKPWADPVWHLFVIRVENRKNLIADLAKYGVETSIHYPTPLPKLSAYKHLNQSNEKGFAWESAGKLISLPIGPHLTQDDVYFVCDKLKKLSF
jgi:dTDP-4-amino-4,6-dideoxygalactose transaminase